MKSLVILQPSLRFLDPHTCSDAAAVKNWRFALYEALVEHDGEGFAPVLAESWRCGEDARTWTFTLREGVRFHDGKPLTAGDVLYSLGRAFGPLAEGELFMVTYRDYLGTAQLEAADDRTVRLTAPEPMADILDLLCDIVIIPEGALSDRLLDGEDPRSADRLPAGTGPYLLDSFEAEAALLRSWVQYRRGGRRQQLVEFRAVPEQRQRIEMLEAGRADLITRLSPASAEAFEQAQDCDLWPVASNLCVIYLMNLSSDCLTDIRVRQALNYGIDKQRIICELLNGQGRVLNGPLSNLHFGYDPGIPAFAFDRKRARKLLAQAGFRGQGVLLHTPTSVPDEAPQLTEMVADQLEALGIKAEIEQHADRRQYARAVAEKRLQGLVCFDSSPLSTFRVLREKLDSRFHGPWWQGYHSRRANELLSRAASTVDKAQRQALYRKAYRIYRDEAPWLYLYQPHELWAIRSRARSCVRANKEAVLRFR